MYIKRRERRVMDHSVADLNGVSDGEIAVTGVLFDRYSSYMKGTAQAPPKIREALFSESSNMWTEDLTDLGTTTGWHFLPDYTLPADHAAFSFIEGQTLQLLKRNVRVISLGGDHSITLPIIRAYAARYKRLNILHFDAHPDLYDELNGNRYSHACPFARIMEEKLVTRIVQVGIRTMTGHQYEQAKRFGVEVHDMAHIDAASQLTFEDPVYISLDLDCLDPAFAPGVSHHEPGGMSTREVLNVIQQLQGNVVGADIVEYNPERDIHEMTAMVAAKLLKELLAKILKCSNQQ